MDFCIQKNTYLCENSYFCPFKPNIKSLITRLPPQKKNIHGANGALGLIGIDAPVNSDREQRLD